MDDFGIAFKFLLSLVLGAAIGLERESHEKDVEKRAPGAGVLGIRTISLITALGATAGLLYSSYAGISLILTTAFVALVIGHYILTSMKTRDPGITTEIAVILAFLIGFFIMVNAVPTQMAVAMTVVLMLILSRKEKIKTLVNKTTRPEINAFISYAIIALAILPFLPNTSYALTDIPLVKTLVSSLGWDISRLNDVEILNPSRLWLIVALITGIDMAGYVLEKTIGQKKGFLLASITGGFISSTATTISIAQNSKEKKNTSFLVASALFSNMASFVPLIVLIATIQPRLLLYALPLTIILMASSLLSGLYFYMRSKRSTHGSDTKNEPHTQIFALAPALKFAALFLAVRIVSKISLAYFGNSGLFATTAIAATTGIDAIVINTAELFESAINAHTAILNLIIANAVNLGSKIVYSFMQGTKEFALHFSVAAIIIIASSFAALLFV